MNFFGVTIDNNPNFTSHIKETCSKVNQKTSDLSRLQGHNSENKAKLLLNTFVM